MSLWEIYKAKRLGYADDLWASLIGHQLGGYSWQSDYETTPYLYRAMPNLSHYYNREIMEEVVGGSVGFNQLCNGSSVTVQSGHKYFLKKGSAESVATSAGSAITGLTSGSDIVVDLTLALGSTIADYVYSLEQATAGSGVAWLKEHFPKMCQYNPYDAGSIQSVSGLVSHTTKDANDNVIGSYPLDSTLTLRGIPKLDNGKLYYDGDTYEADGTVNRKYGIRAYQSGDESLADAVTDGTNTVYKLATPTTETAQPFTKTQLCDSGGTEEFVATGVNVWDEEWEVGGLTVSGGVPTANDNAIRSKTFCKCVPSQQYCYTKPSATFGGIYWYDENKAFIQADGFRSLATNVITAPTNAHYFKVQVGDAQKAYTTYNHDISINYPSTDTAYHPYGCLVSVGHKSKYAEK